MKIKQFISSIAAVSLITACMPAIPVYAEESTMRDITTMELVHDMGIGINLGNTYESCGDWIAQWGDGTPESYETAWGSPVITKEMIQGYADSGFDTLRIPVAWSNMMVENNQISPLYLETVREAVDWALECDMYVIMNLHWDSGWLEKLPEDKENVMKKYSDIWTQLCEEFKDYDDYLIFESQNEELGWSSLWNIWGGTEGKDESYALVNEVNQTFVDIVRSSGGNNPARHLLISGYNTSIELTCDPLFKMPSDPANRMAVSVHYYTPSCFAILEEDADWGKASSTWGTDAEIAELERNMNLMKTTFVDNGIPVIIGEYGCPKKNKEEESIRKFLSSVCQEAYDRNMCPVLWDVTDLHYDRKTCKMTDPELNKLLVAVKPAEENPKVIKGDVNSDSEFSLADLVMMQNFLLDNGSIIDWKAGDLCKDNKIDVFDMCIMRAEYAKTFLAANIQED
ncbi:MAG: cellulase family glycosylhydrolase [Ruminococcus sp.]|nr:cellulase family glycosylhydrolase [Ruminococcus sp.]